MASREPTGQARNAYERDWGNFATVATMPNGSGDASASTRQGLEAGDTCYLSASGSEGGYLCVSAGTIGMGNAVWVPSSGQGPWSSVLYVDNVRGSDTTGQRGNANRPFATVQAAINAAQTDDQIQCAPQLFTTTAAYTVPASVVRLSLVGTVGVAIGSSIPGGGTLLVNNTTNLFELGANLGLSSFAISTMVLRSSGHLVVNADGSSYAKDTFLTNGLRLDDVGVTSGGLSTKYVGNFTLKGAALSTSLGSLSIVNGGGASIFSLQAQNCVSTFSYDPADPLSTSSQLAVRLNQGTQLGVGGSTSATLGGAARLLIDQTSCVGGLLGSSLVVSGAIVPLVACCGYIGQGGVDFATAGRELPDTATALTFDFRGTRFYNANSNAGQGNLSAATIKCKVGGAAGNFQTVRLDSSVTYPACTITADAKIHLTGRGANWPQVTLTTPGADGDIIPPQLTGTVDVSAGGALAKTWVQLGYAGLIRTGAACDTAFLTESAAASDPFIAAKATTGLTITSVAVGGDTACNWLAIWK